MNDIAGGIAAGVVAGLAVGATMQSAEQARQRRLSQRGNDQILIESKKDMETVGNAIAKAKEVLNEDDTWEYNGGEIITKPHAGSFDLEWGILTAIGVAVILVLIFISTMNMGWFNKFPLDIWSGFLVSIGVGVAIGFLFGSTPYETEYIRLSPKGNKGTTILLKIYDSDGYRNLDEDEILAIIDKIESC